LGAKICRISARCAWPAGQDDPVLSATIEDFNALMLKIMTVAAAVGGVAWRGNPGFDKNQTNADN